MVSDIAFPEYKGISIATHLHEYILYNYREILLVIDQEKYSLDKIHETFRRGVLGLRNYEIIQESSLRVATAEIHYRHTAHLILVINGLDDERFSRHTIEDLLLLLAEKLGLHTIKGTVNPKDEWNCLSEDVQSKVYEAIRYGKEIDEIFKQHTIALKIFKKHSPSQLLDENKIP